MSCMHGKPFDPNYKQFRISFPAPLLLDATSTCPQTQSVINHTSTIHRCKKKHFKRVQNKKEIEKWGSLEMTNGQDLGVNVASRRE